MACPIGKLAAVNQSSEHRSPILNIQLADSSPHGKKQRAGRQKVFPGHVSSSKHPSSSHVTCQFGLHLISSSAVACFISFGPDSNCFNSVCHLQPAQLRVWTLVLFSLHSSPFIPALGSCSNSKGENVSCKLRGLMHAASTPMSPLASFQGF